MNAEENFLFYKFAAMMPQTIFFWYLFGRLTHQKKSMFLLAFGYCEKKSLPTKQLRTMYLNIVHRGF